MARLSWPGDRLPCRSKTPPELPLPHPPLAWPNFHGPATGSPAAAACAGLALDRRTRTRYPDSPSAVAQREPALDCPRRLPLPHVPQSPLHHVPTAQRRLGHVPAPCGPAPSGAAAAHAVTSRRHVVTSRRHIVTSRRHVPSPVPQPGAPHPRRPARPTSLPPRNGPPVTAHAPPAPAFIRVTPPRAHVPRPRVRTW